MESKKLYSALITRGKRSYFFDIKRSENESLFLSLTESRKKEDAFERHNIIIFQDDLSNFKSVLEHTLFKFDELIGQNHSKKKYSMEERRKVNRQAYLPWSAEADERLEVLFCEGSSIKEMSKIFERTLGAIKSRIKKLELREKYE